MPQPTASTIQNRASTPLKVNSRSGLRATLKHRNFSGEVCATPANYLGVDILLRPSLQKEARPFFDVVCRSKLYRSHHAATFQLSSTVSCQSFQTPTRCTTFRLAKILVILAYLALCCRLSVKLVSDLQSPHNARRHVQDTCRAAVDTPYPEKRMVSKLPHPHQNIPCHREVEGLPS